MQKLLFSPSAQNDLDGIYDYTVEVWGFEQAESYVRELYEVCHTLATGSTKGQRVDFIR